MLKKILNTFGGGQDKKRLTKEISAPSTTGIRQVWHSGAVAGELTPARLADIIKAANTGSAEDYLTLAEEMEERDPHYASVLGTRKRAVSGLQVIVEAAAEDKKSLDQADFIRSIIKRASFRLLGNRLLDGIAKGYSVCEIIWQFGKTWKPKEYIWRDPRYFIFGEDDAHTPRLLDEADPINGLSLEEYKYIVHKPELKCGIPIRGGLARLAAAAYMCKSFTLGDWMSFLEVFGMPIRIGKYGPSASKEDKEKLASAVANIGSDAAALIPDSMKVEFIERANTGGGGVLFKSAAEWLDKQVSKAVLGQTMTADDGSSKSQAQVHDLVRRDILTFDADQLSNTINIYFTEPVINLNFGVQDNYPRVVFFVPKPADITVLADALSKLVPLGLQVRAQEVRDKMGLEDPKEGDEILSSPSETALNARQKSLNTAKDENPEFYDWEKLIKPIINPVQALAKASGSFDEFMAKLPGLTDKMDSTQLINWLALAAFKSHIDGYEKDEISD